MRNSTIIKSALALMVVTLSVAAILLLNGRTGNQPENSIQEITGEIPATKKAVATTQIKLLDLDKDAKNTIFPRSVSDDSGSLVKVPETVFSQSDFFKRAKSGDLAMLEAPAIDYSSKESEGKDGYDRPDLAIELEFEKTRNPSTGRVPRELLIEAIEKTKESKEKQEAKGGSSDSLTLLSWLERGPNRDLPGPSNGNTRANNSLASGRVRAVLVDSADPTGKTVWIGGVAGGLWKTTDITASPPTWTLINDFFTNLAISAIVQHPTNSNIMYFTTGEGYFNADAVLGNGVWSSTDNGATWNQIANTSTWTVNRMVVDTTGNLYVGTRDVGLQRSTDGGANWTVITPTGSSSRIADLELSSTGRLHVTTGLGNTSIGQYRFTDTPTTVAAGTWTAATTPFPYPSGANCRVELGVHGNILYALPSNTSGQAPILYRSTDGGVTWAATAGQPSATWASGQAWYNLAVGIDPSDPTNSAIIGALDTWKTTNGGANWTQISTWVGITPVNQYVHADVHNVVWYDNGNKLVVASDGGIFYSDNKGSSYSDRNEGLRIKQFYSIAVHPFSTNYFLGGTQDNGTHQFNNPGIGSTVEVTGGDGAYVDIDQDQPQFQFGAFVFNQYRRSTNGGATWSSVNFSSSAGRFINPFDFDDVNNRFYAAWSAGQYLRWNDPQTGTSGTTFTIPAFNSAIVSAVTVSPNTANRVFFGTGGTTGGRIVRIDNAETATPTATNITDGAMPAGGYVSSIYVDPTSDNNIIVTFSNYGVQSVWVTNNAGGTWTSLDNNGVNLPDMPVRWAIFKPGDITKAYIATETGIWETSMINGTTTVWDANTTFPITRTDMLKYRSSDNLLAAATHGRGLWTSYVPANANPEIQFLQPNDVKAESTGANDACRGYKDYSFDMVILNEPTGAATVNLGVQAGGTATQGVDYDLMGTSLNFASGVTAPQPFTIRVYDDSAVESAETFTLNYTISGATNAVAGTANQTFTFTINDNDKAPIAASNSNVSIGTYDANLNVQTPFRSDLARFRMQFLITAAELNAQGITSAANLSSMTLRVDTKNSTQPYNGFTISLGNTTTSSLGNFISPAFTQVFNGNYSTVVGDNLFNFSTPFAWDGVSNIVVNICWDNASAGTAADITEGTAAPLGALVRASAYSSSTATAGCSLPAAFIADPRVTVKFDVAVIGTPFANTLGSSKSAYLGPLDDVPFYDSSGNILARIKNNGAFNYGCTTVDIDRAGTSAVAFSNNNAENFLASKSYRVIPTNNTTTGNYDITLYYTAAEIAGYNAAAAPSTFSSTKLAKVSNGFFIPDVTPSTPRFADTIVSAATSGAFGTFGQTATANFNNTGFSGFGTGNPLAPSAANVSVSGRVLTAKGRGISRAVVRVTDLFGQVRTAVTNPFGYYSFTDLPAGETYTFNVDSKQYQFTPQTINLEDSLSNFNFIAN